MLQEIYKHSAVQYLGLFFVSVVAGAGVLLAIQSLPNLVHAQDADPACERSETNSSTADEDCSDTTAPKQKKGDNKNNTNPSNYKETDVGAPKCPTTSTDPQTESDRWFNATTSTCETGYAASGKQKFVASPNDPNYKAPMGGPICPIGFWQPKNLNECLEWPRNDPAILNVGSTPAENVTISGSQQFTGGSTFYTSYRQDINTVLRPTIPSGYKFNSWTGCDEVVNNTECRVTVPRATAKRVTLVLDQQ